MTGPDFDVVIIGAGAYLGLVTSGFPNFFMITGPGSPAVFSK